MAEHTPGPWTLLIEEHQPDAEWFAADISVGSPWDGSHRSLASVPEADPRWDSDAQARTRADARLISAAPDLLAALTELAAFFEASSGHRIDADANIGALHAMVKAAIAKALGEASGGD